jgi:hypothetical protein
MRHPLSLLLVAPPLVVALAACGDDPSPAPTAPGTSALAVSAAAAGFGNPFQGMCDSRPAWWPPGPPLGGTTVYPLITQNTKQTVGTVSAFNDDFNAHLVHQTSGGVRVARTSTQVLENHPDQELPPWLISSTGRIIFEKLHLQRRYSPPVATAHAFIPLDSAANYLIEINYTSWARVVSSALDEPAWAGEGPGIFGDRIEDPNARQFMHGLRDCGRRVVLFNDINLFDDVGMSNPDNQRMIENITWSTYYTGWDQGGARSGETGAIFDRGRSSPCWANGECDDAHLSTLRGILGAVTDVFSTSGTLTSFPPDVGMLFLWMPRVPFTVAEINALKQFAAEGGRIVYIGEHAAFYGSAGIATENRFLDAMGSTTVNIGDSERCGAHNDLALGDIPRHRVTAIAKTFARDDPPVNVLRQTCTSVIVPSPKDLLLYGSTDRTQVFGASVAIDLAPIATLRAPRAAAMVPAPAGVKATSTGQ